MVKDEMRRKMKNRKKRKKKEKREREKPVGKIFFLNNFSSF